MLSHSYAPLIFCPFATYRSTACCEQKVDSLEASKIRILIVDDFESWRQFIVSALSKQPHLRIAAEVSDGIAAVEKAKELQPELILLDIGLPSINGIEACRRIRQLSPGSKILFISEHRSSEIVTEAIRSGGCGYVVKSCARNDLPRAVADVLDGRPFVSPSLGQDFSSAVNRGLVGTQNHESPPPKIETHHQHRVEFYRDHEFFINGFYSFTRQALENGNPAFVIATPPHRAAILRRLRHEGTKVDDAIQQGLLIEMDANAVLSNLMRGNLPIGPRVEEIADHLISKGAKLNAEPSKIAICGELAPTLLDQGNVEGAILLEHQVDSIARVRNLDVLCGYILPTITTARVKKVIQRICTEHSAVRLPA